MTKIKLLKEKLSIYLAIDNSKLDKDVIDVEKARKPIAIGVEGAEKATLYIKKNPPPTPPKWTRLFTLFGGVPEEEFEKTRTVGAVFLVNCAGRLFVLSFGTGFHLLKHDAVERDFGLRVTLNSVDPDKLRSLDKASYDHNPLNSRNQSPRDVDIFNLDVDSETEMLYAITGQSNVPEFGTVVTGRDALTLSVEVNLDNLHKILAEASKQYAAPLPARFSWVDNLSRVRTSSQIDELDKRLDDILASGDTTNLWLGEPEIVDWETQAGYSFDLKSKTPRHVVLSFKDFTDHIKPNSPTVELLKSHVVHINDAEFKAVKTWPLYRCLYAEITLKGSQYILRNGIWYKISDAFVQTIDNGLTALKKYGFTFPLYKQDREEEYNETLAAAYPSFSLMDKKNIKIGGVYDKLEHCDLIGNGTDFIHVKFYRSSGTLSHLFAQGFVAAEAFIKDVKYRTELNPKLPKSIQLSDPEPRPNPSHYKVVYAIATKKKVPEELPFFSKVTLKNALATLQALGYEVGIAQIDVDPALLVKKKIKPKKAPKK